MRQKTGLLLFTVFLGTAVCARQNDQQLKQDIEALLSGKKADIGISIPGPGCTDRVEINADKHYPMLSRVKFRLP